VIVGLVIVVGVGVGTGGRFGDGTSVCVCDAGVVRLIDGMGDGDWMGYGRSRGRSGSLRAAVDFSRAL
jgi:hypothetical protein